jgi:hypothetical protein
MSTESLIRPPAFGADSPFPRVENVSFSMSLGNGVVNCRVGTKVFSVPPASTVEGLFTALQAAMK